MSADPPWARPCPLSRALVVMDHLGRADWEHWKPEEGPNFRYPCGSTDMSVHV